MTLSVEEVVGLVFRDKWQILAKWLVLPQEMHFLPLAGHTARLCVCPPQYPEGHHKACFGLALFPNFA